jgi:hypothetical protein
MRVRQTQALGLQTEARISAWLETLCIRANSYCRPPGIAEMHGFLRHAERHARRRMACDARYAQTRLTHD